MISLVIVDITIDFVELIVWTRVGVEVKNGFVVGLVANDLQDTNLGFQLNVYV